MNALQLCQDVVAGGGQLDVWEDVAGEEGKEELRNLYHFWEVSLTMGNSLSQIALSPPGFQKSPSLSHSPKDTLWSIGKSKLSRDVNERINGDPSWVTPWFAYCMVGWPLVDFWHWNWFPDTFMPSLSSCLIKSQYEYSFNIQLYI